MSPACVTWQQVPADWCQVAVGAASAGGGRGHGGRDGAREDNPDDSLPCCPEVKRAEEPNH